MAGEHNVSENRFVNKWSGTDSGVKRHIPLVRISFHTEKKCYQAKGKVIPWNQTELDPSYQVLSVNTQKNMNSPAGGFTISLAGTQWVNRLKSNDMVVIKMGYVGEKTLKTVMVGLIDSVTRRRSMGGETPQVNTTITGRDFGKLFLKTMLRFYPEIGAQEDAKKFFLTDVGWTNMISIFNEDNITKGSPAEMLDRIMRFIMKKLNETEWNVYDEAGSEPAKKKVGFDSIIRYTFEQTNFFLPFMLSADEFEGSIWNLMERAIQKPFTELFIDVRDSSEAWNSSGDKRVVVGTIEQSSSASKHKPGKEGHYHSPAVSVGEDKAKVILAYRETPFDTKNWNRLVRHKVSEVDVINEELSKSDNEHYNLFWAGTTVNPLGVNLKRLMPPLMNEADVKRYGISPLEVQIEGLDVLRENEAEHKVALESLSGAWSAKLKAWYQDNHEHYSGTLDVRGKANYRIGQVLEYTELDKEFYIEGVSHTFSVFDDWNVSLTLTRGVKVGTTVDSGKYVRVPEEPPKEEPPKDEPKPKPKDSYYTVKRGDTLWAISKHYYKKGIKWRKIWEANKDMLIKRDRRNASDHGHWIYPGQKLRIPPK